MTQARRRHSLPRNARPGKRRMRIISSVYTSTIAPSGRLSRFASCSR